MLKITRNKMFEQFLFSILYSGERTKRGGDSYLKMNTVLVVLPLLLSSLYLPVVLADPTVTASR